MENEMESLLSAKKHWELLNLSENIEKAPNESSIEENMKQIHDSKKILTEKTKKLRAKFSGTVPKDEGMDLFENYNKEIERIRLLNSDLYNFVAQLFKNIANAGNPYNVICSTQKIMNSFPDYSAEIQKLKTKIEEEKRKTSEIANLREIREQLKLECDEQVKIATKAAESQSFVDFENEFSKFNEEIRVSESKLQSLQQEIQQTDILYEKSKEELEKTQSSVTISLSILHEQIDSLNSELSELSMTKIEMESISKDSEKRKEIEELQNEIETKKENRERITLELKDREEDFETNRTKKEAEKNVLELKITNLKAQIDVIEQTMAELPSPAEWNRIKKEVAIIRSKNELLKQKSELQDSIVTLGNEREKLEKESMQKTTELQKERQKLNRMKQKVERIVDNANIDSEVADVLRTQKKSLIEKQKKLEDEVKLTKAQNLSIKSDKETLENELQIVRKNLRTMPNVSNRTVNDLINKENSLAQKGLNKLIDSRNFRIYFVGYILLLHLIILFVTVFNLFK